MKLSEGLLPPIGRRYTGRDSLHYGVARSSPRERRSSAPHLIIRVPSRPEGEIKEEDTLRVSSSFIWYTGRDSNPQPSEPESDALSIEPPVHLLHSLNIIAVFSFFVK